MSVTRSSVAFTSMLVIVMVFPEHSDCGNASARHVATECGQEVILDNPDADNLAVSLTFSQAQPHGASCSWLIPAGNATMSNQILITNTANLDALACNDEAFFVSEKDPASGSLHPLKLECGNYSTSAGQSPYHPVVGHPGFSILVSLNTTLSLSENFTFMFVMPFVWRDEVCPRNDRKVVVIYPGAEEDAATYYPRSAGLLSRFPDNLECKWELRSSDEGLVHLVFTSFCGGQEEPQGRDHFVFTNQNNSASPIIVLLCKYPGISFFFDYTSTTGSVFVTFKSDNSSGASQNFYLRYWSVESCPSTPLRLKAYFKEKYLIKGSSFSAHGAGQEQTCHWEIKAYSGNAIKLYQLEAQEFQQNCDENKDYLIVNDRKVSICSGSMFPIWSNHETMNITFHTSTTLLRRSFLLNYTSVFKSPCQGYPQRKTIVGSNIAEDRVPLMPIPQGDIQNGQMCQWLFTAKGTGNSVTVSVDWAEAGSDTEKYGVNFNQETCCYANFRVYDGNIANDSTEITPTCSKDKSSIVYTSTSRDMLFVYDRGFNVAESGFVMKVSEVLHSTSGDGLGTDGSWIIWATVLLGLIALLLSYEY